MFNIAFIKKLLRALNTELSKMDVVGEVGLCGGAVMCLVFHARPATKDIDAIFAPTREIRLASKRVAKQLGVDEHWLNDAAKGYFHADPPKDNVLELSHLRVWAPRADYMLAMKCIAARFDTHDTEDIRFLLQYLVLTTPTQVFDLVAKYYPRTHIPAKTQFAVEELMAHADPTP